MKNLKKITALLLVMLLLLPFSVAEAREIYDLHLEDQTTAFLLGDYGSGQILENYNADEPIEIASLSKLLTYYVIRDEINSGRLELNDKVTVTAEDVSVEGANFKMQPGEVYMVSELLEAMLVLSANDATKAITRHVAGSEEAFIDMMTTKAQSLGLDNAKLYNATGLPTGEGHLQNRMTTKEVFTLIRSLIMDYPDVLQTTNKPFITQEDRDFLEPNTNPLVEKVDYIDGIKTGYTEKAGYCLAVTGYQEGIEEETEPMRLIAIVMGTDGYEEREAAARELIQFGFDEYEWKILGAPNVVLGTATFSKGSPYQAPYFATQSQSVLGRIGEEYETEVVFQENKELPIAAGDVIGDISFYRGNEEVFATKVQVQEEIQPAGFLTLFQREFSAHIKAFSSYFTPLQ